MYSYIIFTRFFEFRSFSANTYVLLQVPLDIFLWTKKKVPVIYVLFFESEDATILFCNREMDILMVIKSTVQVRKLILTLLIILIILQSWCAGARVICWVCSKTHWLRFISSTLRMNANFLVLPESSWTQPAIRMNNSEMKSEKNIHEMYIIWTLLYT